MKACLLLYCFSLETSSLFGTFLPCGRRAGRMRRFSLLPTSLWSVQQSAPHSVCHSDILSVIPLYYDIINEMHMFGATMHPLRLVANWQTEDCVSDQQFMLCTLLQKEEVIAIALTYSFNPNHSFPGLVVCAHSTTEVSQKDEFVCPGCSRNHRIQIIIELVFDLIWVGHCGCIGTYNSWLPLTR